MASVQPIMVSEVTAAKMLDVTLPVFKRLVADGVLPRGREITLGLTRWDVEELRRIARGEAVDGMRDVNWGGG
jgi:hypothetical protein